MFTYSKHDILIIYYSINTDKFLNQFTNFLHLISMTFQYKIYFIEMVIYLLHTIRADKNQIVSKGERRQKLRQLLGLI